MSLAAIMFLSACDKKEDLKVFNNGMAPVLTASSNAVAPQVADSNNVAVTFNWTNPGYANHTDTLNKYIVQIDSTGKNFANPTSFTVIGSTKLQLKGKDVTNMLVARGYAYNTPVSMDVRVISSYANNNEPLMSNVVTVKMTAYVTPPKVMLPVNSRLFIVGDATQGGWNNPVPTPTQEFSRIDSVTYVGVFNMVGGKEFLVLPINGDWTNKYSLQSNQVANVNVAGDFDYNKPDNFKGPATSGWYKITLDFQRGKYKIEPYTGPQIPTNLFIVGDATPGGWNNPVPVPSQQFTQINSTEFVINSLAITPSKEYLLLPVNGDWTNKYAIDNTTAATSAGGYFGYNRATNFPGPTVAGNYKIQVNFGIAQKVNGAEVANTAWYKTTKL